jgi:hypothetical protein
MRITDIIIIKEDASVRRLNKFGFTDDKDNLYTLNVFAGDEPSDFKASIVTNRGARLQLNTLMKNSRKRNSISDLSEYVHNYIRGLYYAADGSFKNPSAQTIVTALKSLTNITNLTVTR